MKKLLAAIAVLALAGVVQAEEKVDFAKQVEPLLAQSCFKSAMARKNKKGKLRLDNLAALLKPAGKDGKVVEPGNILPRARCIGELFCPRTTMM